MSSLEHDEPAAMTYPPDWEDEERMHFLLGPFSSTALMSVADQKVRFWSSLVCNACRLNRQPVFSERHMVQKLQWRGQAPSCLGHVLQVMEQAGELRLLQETAGGRSSGWFSWGVSMVSNPVKWLWRGYVSRSNSPVANKIYVDTRLLKELAESVLQQLQSRVEFRSTDRLLTRSQLKLVTGELVEASSVWVVEQELVKQGKLSFRTSSTGIQVVKFIAAGENGPVNVSDVDEGILSLKESVTTLQTHTSSLKERIKSLKTKAKDHLQCKQRQLAVNCVRRSHEFQHVLSNKVAMLDNLQHILHQIQMAETDVMVLEAYRKGTKALKTIQKESGFSLLEAEKAVDELNEVVQDSEEVRAVLGEGVGSGVEDEEELERELQDILFDVDPASAATTAEEDSLAEKLSQLQLLKIPPSQEFRDRPNVMPASEDQTKAFSNKCQPQLS